MSTYVETDCTFTHQGRTFSAGGAVVTPDRIVAYLGKRGVLTDWHGSELGTWRAVASWPMTPDRSGTSWGRMFQVEASVGGMVYTGRSQGESMVYSGKRKANRR